MKQRDFHPSKYLTKDIRLAAKQLKDDPDIIVRKADKSNVFVIMNKNEYKQKLYLILSDTQNLKKITHNPINELKIEANKLIKKVNLVVNNTS